MIKCLQKKSVVFLGKKTLKYFESIMAHKKPSECGKRILVSKGQSRVQFGTRLSTFVKDELGNQGIEGKSS